MILLFFLAPNYEDINRDKIYLIIRNDEMKNISVYFIYKIIN